ncbi:protein NODULATION SIGNALING PATHWAY 2-like [Juglans microcarpa x Juglans regia]|uniref:protein NODULATION SIGNALING PATHWAY 2-like n=1 Tax=Juglans microcarpa x Juglans regia TaxID=2249226 RepID=UPI001B7D96AE|nr:protein NODULATION SIGNALING PATHWAY 2-like [Juglans microcarpa x Juglans regia]
MMQPELLDQLSWPFYDVIDSIFYEGAHHGQSMEFAPFDGYGFPSILTTTEDSSELSSASFSSTIFPSEFVRYQFYADSQPVMLAMRSDFSTELGILENILNDDETVGMDYIIEESEGSFSLKQSSTAGEEFLCPSPSMISESSPDVSSNNQPLVTLPGEDMEIDNLRTVYHLLKAYGETFEKDERELAQVILRRISEKVSPIGKSLERVAFYLCQDVENQGDYLKQESCKNFEAAFQAFYQSFPEGKFAHYAANSAILDAMPGVVETIHIVDFHMGEGVQWPPMMEAIAHQHKTLRLTSIKWEEDARSLWSFEETKRRLHNQARVLGLKLKVEEMGIEDLVSETRKMQKRDSRREWMVFNCMFSLPHMGRGRSRTLVMEFLKVAKELISSSTNSCNRGIVTFGDGDAYDKLKHCSGFGSFFEGYVEHYQALLESLRMNFPPHLLEARIAIECLFVAPCISSLSWLHKWEEMMNGCHPQERLGLEGRKLSQEILAEAKEMVKEGESSYGARIVGQIGNEMVLEWKGITMVRVSIWTNQL